MVTRKFRKEGKAELCGGGMRLPGSALIGRGRISLKLGLCRGGLPSARAMSSDGVVGFGTRNFRKKRK